MIHAAFNQWRRLVRGFVNAVIWIWEIIFSQTSCKTIQDHLISVAGLLGGNYSITFIGIPHFTNCVENWTSCLLSSHRLSIEVRCNEFNMRFGTSALITISLYMYIYIYIYIYVCVCVCSYVYMSSISFTAVLADTLESSGAMPSHVQRWIWRYMSS